MLNIVLFVAGIIIGYSIRYIQNIEYSKNKKKFSRTYNHRRNYRNNNNYNYRNNRIRTYED